MTRALHRTIGRFAVGGLTAAAATLYGQTRYVARLDLPHHPDLDASGPIGPEGAPPVRVVVLGDSACTGPGLDDPDDIWIRGLLARFDDHRFEVTSFAKGGAKTTDVLVTQVPSALLQDHDLAVVSVGANDALHGHPTRAIAARVGRIVDALLDSTVVVVLPGVGDVGTAPRIPFPLSRAASLVAARADRAQAKVAATRPRVRKAPMWPLTAEPFATRDDVWSTDRYHPNAAGHAIWADAVHDTMAAALADLGRREGRGLPS